jgi:hypothetical protein
MSVSTNNRTSLTVGAPQYFQGPAGVLRSTGGIMFPIQPDIVYSQSVNYSPYDLVHTNYTYNTYRNTPSPSIQITAQFVNSTQDEHVYTQGVIHFLRSVTKMYYGFGDLDGQGGAVAGTPPPVLRFSSYGQTLFNNVPVVVSMVSIPFQSDTDLIEVNGVALPAVMTVALDIMVQQSPARQKTQFSKAAFLSGSAYGNGFI